MTSLILRTTSRPLVALMLLFSIFLLLRGHNEPGGGFIGGLVAGGAFILFSIAFSPAETRSLLRITPRTMIGIGLLSALGAGVIALIAGRPFLTGLWQTVDLPGFGEVVLGTTLLFDLGVFLVVLGVTMLIVLTLAEE